MLNVLSCLLAFAAVVLNAYCVWMYYEEGQPAQAIPHIILGIANVGVLVVVLLRM